MNVHTRWMIRFDLQAVLDIERRSFASPWTEQDFMNELRSRSGVGIVAEVDELIVGYFVYEPHETYLRLIRAAVHPEWRGIGIGAQMLTKLTSRLGRRRKTVRCMVRESNLKAQLWLRACGFHATTIERQPFEDSAEDAYRFTYRLRDGADETKILATSEVYPGTEEARGQAR